MNDYLTHRKGHSEPDTCKGTAVGSAWLMLGVEAAAVVWPWPRGWRDKE